MKNNKCIKIIIIVILILILFIILSIKKNNNYERKVTNIAKENNNLLSMMLETSAGSGEYQKTSASAWPTEGYTFNENLSKCENGSTLSWDNEKNIVVVSGNMSDKCYVYFDAKSPYYLEIGTKLTTTYIDCWVTKECKITYYGNKPQHTLYVMYYFNEITLDVIEEILESYYVVSSVGGISQPTNLEKGYAIHDNYYLV